MKHTEGPWEVHGLNQKNDADRSIVARTRVHNNPIYVARVYGEGPLALASEERIANTRLIAAAPELYSALSQCVTVLSHLLEHSHYAENIVRQGSTEHACAVSQAILAKLEGEKP